MSSQVSHLLDRCSPDATDAGSLGAVVAAEIDHLAGRPGRWAHPESTAPPAIVARALLDAGRPGDARRALSASPPPDRWSPQELAATSFVLSRVGTPAGIAAAREALAARAGSAGPFLHQGDVPLGPVALFDGMLAAAAGEAEEGVALLRSATRVGDERAPVWGAVARHELVRLLHDKAADDPGGPTAECAAMATSARMFFVSAGYGHRRRLLDEIGTVGADGVAMPGIGVLVEGPAWSVGFGVQPPVEVAASKGLRAIRYLIDHRDRRVPAVELDAALADDADQRLADLRQRIVQHAESGTEDLRGVLVDDRVRIRTSKLVRRTIARLTTDHPRLGRHLEATVETGHSCAYTAGDHVRWRGMERGCGS